MRQVQSGTDNELRVYFSPEAKQLIFHDSNMSPIATNTTGKDCHEVGYVVHPSRDGADSAVEVYSRNRVRNRQFTQGYQNREPLPNRATPASRVLSGHERITGDTESDSDLFALAISINEHTKITRLTGAAADAGEVSDLLTINLKVPGDHIINLRDEEASREEIIWALCSLKNNQRIHEGDPILVYYAGHGELKKVSDEWKARYSADVIQFIFPCDYNMEIPESKEVVSCIPDWTIAVLLNELAAVKGDNITVIFDSCHSEAGSRGGSGDEDDGTGRVARGANIDIDVPPDIDADNLRTNQSSHAFYASCGSNERAYEKQGRGAFTVALLDTIRASGINNITHRKLIASLPLIPDQSPHYCYSVHKSQILFSSRASPPKLPLIRPMPRRVILFLKAGESLGVAPNSVWKLYTSAMGDSPTFGFFKAHIPSISCAALVPKDDETRDQILNTAKSSSESPLYARQVQPGTGNELKAYFSPEAKQLIFHDPNTNPVTTNTIGRNCHEVGYVVHPSQDGADIAVEVYNPYSAPGSEQASSTNVPSAETEAVFFLYHPEAEKCGTSQMKYCKPARREEVEPVLFAAARWNWHLKRTNNSVRSSSTVSMEMMKLCERYGDYTIPVEGPLVDLNKTGVVEFAVKEEDRYELRLSSQALVPLYIQVFYFDAMDFSIRKISGYSCANGQQDHEIPAGGQFMVGDDRKGGSPIGFAVTPGAAFEVGFMKVFWSTDPLELDHLDPDLGCQSKLLDSIMEPRVPFQDERRVVEDWGTVLVTLMYCA
ncbi:hypothetical protein BDV93DRAFT_552894 [Ceratobasidium sp. AG-I]|nr:hypothetical protein BDV93DRAFT_552894 [Ceratobasidium sp. AG-I]